MKKLNNNKWLDLKVFSIQIAYLSIVIVIGVILSILIPATIYFSLTIILLVAFSCIYVCLRELRNRKHRIEELSSTVDIVLKDSLNLIDVPMVMVNDANQILWQNKNAKHKLPKEYILDTAIQINTQGQSKNIVLEVGDGEIYLAIGNNIRFANFDCNLITYINKTEESKLKQTLEDTKVTVGIVFVDNYEETMQGLDELTKAEITSKIAKEIREWANEKKGVITKIDKDKYVVFIEKQYVDAMEKESFEIIERVKNITDKTKLPVTVSLGLSYSENTLEERYIAGTSALDIALGRGGDQVVLKKDKKFDFYGGSNLGLEKTSRVRARTIAHALREIIEKSDKVYVMGHKNSDIDCVGAAVGIYKMAKSLNKPANIIIDSKCNASTKLLIEKVKKNSDYEEAFVLGSDLKKVDFTNSLLVVVDTHKKSYLAYPELLDNFEKVVVIDHHRRGPEFIDNALLTYHELYASSASELVTEILMYLEDIKLTTDEAESLYAGIVVDTKNFIFKTGVRTFEVAAYLKKFGIDLTEVKQLFQSDFETYVAKIDIVKNAEIIKGKIAVSVSEETFDDMPIIAAQAADELLSITGIMASFVLCKVENIVMISGRSMGDVNVQAIMEKIGGGGHLTFAGAQIAGVSLEEARKKIIDIIDEYFSKD